MTLFKSLRLITLSFLLASVASCGLEQVSFKPQFYAHDYLNSQIINRKGETIACNIEDFNGYASLSLIQIAELANILRVAKVPKRFKFRKDLLLQSIENTTK